MARVFVLGAGASRFSGYPLGNELWQFLQRWKTSEMGGAERDKRVTAAIEKIGRAVGRQEVFENLEELVTFLDLAVAGADPLGVQKLNWARERPGLIGMIADAFMWYEYCLQNEIVEGKKGFVPGIDVGAVQRTLDAWTGAVRPGDVVITFNWDILHDTALWRAGKWDYSDGYGFRGPEVGSRGASRILLLKLHGSVNWAQNDESDMEPALQHTRDFFGTPGDSDQYLKAAGQRDRGRPLVLPTYLKDLSSNRLLLSLWTRAEASLVEAEEVIVIGFGLQPADALARYLLGSSLLRNRNVDSVAVVAPRGGATHWWRFCTGVGKEARFLNQAFEDWVLA